MGVLRVTNKKTVASKGEFGLIDHCFKGLGRTDVPGIGVGIGDDAAVLLVPRTQDLLTTSDTLVEGVHFTRELDPRLLGWKAMCVNLSDIAAMGGEPRWCLLSIALPLDTPLAWVEQFALGMGEAGERYRVALVGGDTSATSGPVVVTISMFGVIGHGRSLLRSGAEVGNRIFVSGTIGDSALGLRRFLGIDQEGQANLDADGVFLINRHLKPSPRIDLGLTLVDAAVVRAAIDISDGLLADTERLCAASGVGADLDLGKIPLSPAARRWLENGGQDAWRTLLTGGEDYELLFTVTPGALEYIPAIATNLGLPLTQIGVVTEQKGVRILDCGTPLTIQGSGFKHF